VNKIRPSLKYLYSSSNGSFTLITMSTSQVEALVDNKVVSIAYETVQLPDRSLPLLTPMSEVAAFVPAWPPPIIVTLPFGTPGTPPSKIPIPPLIVLPTKQFNYQIVLYLY
jgi:hypothetical protein